MRLLVLLALCLVNVKCIGQALTLADPAHVGVRDGAASAPSYLVLEDFEETGTPTSGYWSGTTGDVNFDEQTVVLRGSESLAVDGGAQLSYVRCTSFGNEVNPIYGFFDFALSSIPSSSSKVFLFLQSGGASMAQAQINTSGQISIRAFDGAFATGGTPTTLVTNTLYRIWWDFTASTGSDDGTFNVYLSTTTTKPGAPEVSRSNGTKTNIVNRVIPYASNGGPIYYFDHFIVDDENIGSNP